MRTFLGSRHAAPASRFHRCHGCFQGLWAWCLHSSHGCRVGVAAKLARLAAKCRGHVGLEGISDAKADALQARLGPRHNLGLTLDAFTVVLSVKIDESAHINIEEAAALVRYVRWLLRAAARQGHRVVVLIDSRVVLGAAAKGRSSSKGLNRLLRQLAALTFAGDLVLHLVFVPSAHNPSDHPSRGPAWSWPAALRHGKTIVTRLTGSERRVAELNASWDHLVKCGAVSDGDGSSSLSSEDF